MIYISSFKVSERRTTNPNLYPHKVFRNKNIYPFVFAPITIFYGNNGSGKSTLLNLIAHKIQAKGYAEFVQQSSVWTNLCRNVCLSTVRMIMAESFNYPREVYI